MEEKHPYEDILHLSRPVSQNRPRMTMLERAAQFSPFAALTGYEDTIRETARLTEDEAEADEEQLALLNQKLQLLTEQANRQPTVTVTWFESDERKSGGYYRTETVRIRRVDLIGRVLITTEQTAIPMDRISALSGDIFSMLEAML